MSRNKIHFVLDRSINKTYYEPYSETDIVLTAKKKLSYGKSRNFNFNTGEIK